MSATADPDRPANSIEDKIFTSCEKMGVTVEDAVTKIDDELHGIE